MLKTGTTQIQTQKRKRIPGAGTSVSAKGGGGGRRVGGVWRRAGGVEGPRGVGAGGRRGGRGRPAWAEDLQPRRLERGLFCNRAQPSSAGGRALREPGPGEGPIQERKGRRVPCSAGRGRGTRRADTTGNPGPKPPVSLAAAVWRHRVSWNRCPFGSRVPQSSKVRRFFFPNTLSPR